MSLAIFLYSLPYAANPCSQPGVVFCNGFEGTNQEISDAWGSPQGGAFTAADPGPFNITGNKVLKLGADGTVADVRNWLPQGYDRLYARWYQKWDAGYNWGKSDHQGFIFSSGNGIGAGYTPDGCKNGAVWMLLEPNYVPDHPANGVHWYVYHPGKTTWYGNEFPTGTAPSLATNQWYCMEGMVDLGTPTPTLTGANGVLDLWVNGTHYGPNTCSKYPNRCGGSWFRTCDSLKIRMIELMAYARAERVQPGISIYYDDLVISTQPIGCGNRVGYAPNPLKINTNSPLPEAKKDSTYLLWLSAIGGIKPYSWKISGGALPAGLVLDTLWGKISGTPLAGGTFSFTVRLKDAGTSQTLDKSFTLLVKSSSGFALQGNSRAFAMAEAKIQSGRLVVTIPHNRSKSTLKVFNAMGNIIWEQSINDNGAFAMSPVLANGPYFGQLQGGSKTASFRFAVVK